MQTLSVPQGQFQLARYPIQPKAQLRAWDAADEYLLNQLAEKSLPRDGQRLLILNDSFGALAVALAACRPQCQSDSFLAHQGILANLQQNQLAVEQVQWLDSLQPPQGPVDLVLIKIPKSLAMLEDQLHRLRPLLKPESRLIAAGMTKNIHRSTLQCFEAIIGPTHTSLAKKKARLIFCQPDPTLTPGQNPYPKHYTLEESGLTLLNHANVFSQEKLDIGSRFFLQHLPPTEGPGKIIDLGCGNGVLGLLAAVHNPEAELLFVDESYMALASAQANSSAAFTDRPAVFQATHCLDRIPADSADLILNNPPFHQQHTVGDHIAWQMFMQSRKVLRTDGELWVVGNRHLGYHSKLKKLFGNCEAVASNNKFVIFRAIKC